MIPVNEPLLGAKELEYVNECVRKGWVSSAGPFIEEFEHKWAKYCGRKYGVAVCNGTAALQVAMAALKLAPGDEVIIPTFTIISCALAVISVGGIPIFVDSEPRTWTMDVDRIEEKITARTKAIMMVHIYGHPVDVDPILTIAAHHGLAVIEDAAEAHGAEYLSGHRGTVTKWRRCGGMGVLSCFSFYANKLLTTGEGGMVLTDDQQLAERIRSLRNLCFQGKRRFYHEELGFNFRMTSLQAALGLGQLARMNDIVAKKRWMGHEYTVRLEKIPVLQLPPEEAWARSVFWMYGIVAAEDCGLDSNQIAKRLKAKGIETRPFFLGMHEQPVLRRSKWYRSGVYPVASRLARQGLYLPSGVALTKEQLEEVVAAVSEVFIG